MALKIPSRLNQARELLRSLDWKGLQAEVAREAEARIAIVGPVNAGKSTLFNLLTGRQVSPVSPVPGTTRTLIREQLGPITLIDTPGVGEAGGVDRGQIARQGVAEASAVVLLLDASLGLRQADIHLFRELQATGKPLVVALNKIDLVSRDLGRIVAEAEAQLGATVTPISARTEENVATALIPRILAAEPNLAVLVGRELPRFRRQAAESVIRRAATVNALVGAEPIPVLDLPVLLATQAQMVMRLAAIYDEPLNARHARELLSTIAGGLALRYLAGEAVKVLPGPGWLASASIAAAGTWAIGQVAKAYFESGRRLTPEQMRELYGNLFRWRRRRPAEPAR